MKGHIDIIKMRLKRKKPAIVFVNDYPCDTGWREFGDHATICTHGDHINTLDFRFLTGVRVSISAHSESRAKALFERVKQAGASTVAACHVKTGMPWQQDGWTEVHHG